MYRCMQDPYLLIIVIIPVPFIIIFLYFFCIDHQLKLFCCFDE